MPPASGVGSAGVLPAGGSGIISRSESAPASSCGESPSPPLSPSALITSCAASTVGDRGRVLRGTAGSGHCGVAVLKSRGWGADFPWLVHVLWARLGVAGGARTLAPRAGDCVIVWALGAPPVARVACVAPLRGASEVRRPLFSGCPPLGGCRGPPPVYCGRGCADVGAQHCPLGLHALWGLRAAGLVAGRPRGGWPASVVRGVWCQALSLPRPPVLRGRRPGFRDPCVPAAVGVGVGTQHRPHSFRPCGPSLRVAGVAEGRPRGGVAFHRSEGRLESGAVFQPSACSLGWAAGVPRPLCPGCGWCGRGGPAPASRLASR